jgi:site-specific DNA-methyltransferase (adenine-specific)
MSTQLETVTPEIHDLKPEELTITANSLPLDIIYNGDALEVLKTFPDECIDLVHTSPPYGEIRTNHGFTNTYFKAIALELYRVMKPGAVLVWNVSDQTNDGSESGESFRQVLFFMEVCGLRLLDTMIYLKNSASYPAKQDGARYSDVFEYVFVFSKGKPKTTNLLCDKKNSCSGMKHYGNPCNILPDGSHKQRVNETTPEFSPRNNVQLYRKGEKYTTRITSKDAQAKAVKERLKLHPSKMPCLLALDNIRTWSSEGVDVVLDPFAGAGSTCVMSKAAGRRYIGIEKSAEYCDLIHEWLKLDYDINELIRQSTEECNINYHSQAEKQNRKKSIKRIKSVVASLVKEHPELQDVLDIVAEWKGGNHG